MPPVSVRFILRAPTEPGDVVFLASEGFPVSRRDPHGKRFRFNSGRGCWDLTVSRDIRNGPFEYHYVIVRKSSAIEHDIVRTFNVCSDSVTVHEQWGETKLLAEDHRFQHPGEEKSFLSRFSDDIVESERIAQLTAEERDFIFRDERRKRRTDARKKKRQNHAKLRAKTSRDRTIAEVAVSGPRKDDYVRTAPLQGAQVSFGVGTARRVGAGGEDRCIHRRFRASDREKSSEMEDDSGSKKEQLPEFPALGESVVTMKPIIQDSSGGATLIAALDGATISGDGSKGGSKRREGAHSALANTEEYQRVKKRMQKTSHHDSHTKRVGLALPMRRRARLPLSTSSSWIDSDEEEPLILPSQLKRMESGDLGAESDESPGHDLHTEEVSLSQPPVVEQEILISDQKPMYVPKEPSKIALPEPQWQESSSRTRADEHPHSQGVTQPRSIARSELSTENAFSKLAHSNPVSSKKRIDAVQDAALPEEGAHDADNEWSESGSDSSVVVAPAPRRHHSKRSGSRKIQKRHPKTRRHNRRSGHKLTSQDSQELLRQMLIENRHVNSSNGLPYFQLLLCTLVATVFLIVFLLIHKTVSAE